MARGKIGKDLVSYLNNLYPDLGLVGKILKEAHQGRATATRRILDAGAAGTDLAYDGLTGATSGAGSGNTPVVSDGTFLIGLNGAGAGYSQISANDNLAFTTTDKPFIEGRVKFTRGGAQATKTFFGFCAAKGVDLQATAKHCVFKINDTGAALSLLICTKDGVITNTNIATNYTIVNDTYYTFKIDASNLSDVKFYVNNDLIPNISIDISNYTGGYQPIFQQEKGAVASTASSTSTYFRVESDRN